MLSFLNAYVFGPLLPVFLICSGLFLSFRLSFFPFRHPLRCLRGMLPGKEKGTLRPTLLALAGTLGVGNITGVAAATAAGGPGALFWMWISAFAASFVKYAEVVLALKYRRREGAGAPYYIRDGLGLTRLACFFSGVLLLADFTVGCPVQVFAAAEALRFSFGIPPAVTGLVFAALVLLALFGGKERISSLTALLVPVLAAFYVLVSAFILVRGAGDLPEVLRSVFRSAFLPDAGKAGVGGFLLSRALRFGTARGVLSNEAGCGTAPFAHAEAKTKVPAEQGLFGILEVMIDTPVLCTLTGLVILLSPEPIGSGGGTGLAIRAYAAGAGETAGKAVALSCALFAYASVIAWAYYGTEALTFLGIGEKGKRCYLFLSGAFTAVGALFSPALVWELADLSTAVMTVTNTSCVLLLSGEVRSETEAYFRREGDASAGFRRSRRTVFHPPR